MKLHIESSNLVRPSFSSALVLALALLGPAGSARAEGETLCVRARTGGMYAVGEGYIRQTCRSGDSIYVPAPKGRGLRFCTLEARAGMTTVSVCACADGEVVEMVGEYSSSPDDLVHELVSTPASASLGDWDPAALGDYRLVLNRLTAEQNGTLTIVLRCAAE